ncbi:MAG: DUF1848 family protein [Desulfobacterales bacterium]
MTNPDRLVISASRRTDIPAFYMPAFMKAIDRGAFEVENPYNRRISRVPSSPERVYAVVFWSKNFGPFLNGGFGEKLQARGYRLFFNFTVNTGLPPLEPNIPPIEHRLDQLAELCRRFGPETINWRFDPICHWREDGRHTASGTANNLATFSQIADRAAGLGIQRCITSFVDRYPKVRRRAAAAGGIRFEDPSLPVKRGIVLKMNSALQSTGIRLMLCCEKEVLDGLTPESGISHGACISGHLLQEIFGGEAPLRPDRGQRRAAGCRCTVSADVGSYRNHPCAHACLYCYGNPTRHAGQAGHGEGGGSG